MRDARPFERAVVVGGGGAVGTLLARRLAGDAAVISIDLPGRGQHLEADIRAPSPAAQAALGAADLVVLATPEDVALQALPALAPLLRSDALLVDTLSVKTPFSRRLAEVRTGCEALGINPMFAPDLDFPGQAVLAVPHGHGGRARDFLDCVRSWGAHVAVHDCESHDRLCAVLQVLTHAAVLGFAAAVAASGRDPRELETCMPPPFRTLLAMAGRILAAPPEVYYDIQVANPWAADARAALAEGLRSLEQAICGGEDAFVARLDGLREFLDRGGTDYAALCARLYQVR